MKQREIKFRAWDSRINKMLSIGDPFEAWYTSDDDGVHFGEMCTFNYKREGFILMQSTGLHDKNGKEVFEGDIVRCSRGCVHEVVWEEAKPFGDMGGWNLSGLTGKYDWIKSHAEVIGNIYENPELLEKKS